MSHPGSRTRFHAGGPASDVQALRPALGASDRRRAFGGSGTEHCQEADGGDGGGTYLREPDGKGCEVHAAFAKDWMNTQLAGKVVVVTGASGGIGSAIA